MMNLSLKDKTAVICGSSQGIGLAAAVELAELGANCILFARNEQALQAALALLPIDEGQQHGYEIADFSDCASVKQAIERIISRQEIHILVNNTGGPKAGPIAAAADEEFTSAFQQHLINNHNLVNAVLPGMMTANYGRIVNIISTSIKTPLANLGVSNTIRAAVAAWAKTLSNEIGAYNITVNNVLPGLTETLRLTALVSGMAIKESKTEAEIFEQLLGTIPLRRFGQAGEIANMIAFLASPAAAYVNGVSIPVDGGRTPSLS
jgi:3-oxoacyl-[acyl-carrier protein] reductase